MEFDENMSLNYSNCVWEAPPINQLNFSRNCTIVAAFARTWLSDESGVDDKAVAAYFRQALPPMLQRQPTNGQLIDWYYDLQINVSFIPSFDACLDPVCKAVDWSGVPDILGPGVMISSWIQAVFSTFLPALFIWKMRLNRQGITPGSRLRWVFEVQNAITGIFINTCLLLNFAIDIAAIVVIARRNSLGESTQVTLAFQLTLFSIFGSIVLVLYPTSMYDILEAYPFPMTVFFTNITLLYVVIGLNWSSASLEYVNSSWEIYCSLGIMSNVSSVTNRVIMIPGCVMILFGIIFLLVPRLLDRYSCPGAAMAIRKRKRAALGIIFWTCGLVMWALLIGITVLRQLLLERSGYNSEDSSWSFGQILALGTFLPLAVEVLNICKDGLEKTVQSRIPTGWVVVKVEEAIA
ncbi:hypothetical protein EDB82DRAFT_482323 [Fusarium venenatum]|uniref:uncharacterized protein n=1 Tax=Fusarium venenatum TaxID=56646 RepID=UPI001DF21D6A|nr:hypothetical protein EDB82DRAFT_482323 [Fusarium venenatum]